MDELKEKLEDVAELISEDVDGVAKKTTELEAVVKSLRAEVEELKKGSRSGGLTFVPLNPYKVGSVDFTPSSVPELGIEAISRSDFPFKPFNLKTPRLEPEHSVVTSSFGHVHNVTTYLKAGPGDRFQILSGSGSAEGSWPMEDAKGVKRFVRVKYVFGGKIPDRQHPDFKLDDQSVVVWESVTVLNVDGVPTCEKYEGHHDCVAKLREWQGS